MRIAARVVALGLLSILLALAVADVWRILGDRGALNATLDGGIGADGPTPAVLGELDEALRARKIADAVTMQHREISAESAAYRVGVVVRHRVVGIPIETVVVREGRFDFQAKLPTLDVFVKAGWTLDPPARAQFEAYSAGRR